MPVRGFDKIESRVNGACPEWKEWPRRLRRIYASLEDWGSSEAAIKDMIWQWGWDSEQINKLIEATPTFTEHLETYRDTGDYPLKKGWIKRLRHAELKAVYIREGELTSFASLDENLKATTHHQTVVRENGMLDLSEPYPERRDLKLSVERDQQEEEYEDNREAETDSGLTSFTKENT